ncbi:MAG: hypothetical protein J0G28_07730 [Afipia sp.]|nr:hypothetical protein [Afipia sp.]
MTAGVMPSLSALSALILLWAPTGSTDAIAATGTDHLQHHRTAWSQAASNIQEGISGGFVFSPAGVTDPANPSNTLALDETLPPQQLRHRFHSYTVRIIEGEDCIICAHLTGQAGDLEVYYDPDGRTISMLRSIDPKAADAENHRVGSLLSDAVGSWASCDDGESLTCSSATIEGLSYIVADDESCQFIVKNNKNPTAIPACAKIGGFQLERPQRPEI